MKVTASVILALSMAFSVTAQAAVQALITKCGNQITACDGAPNANHAYCASQYFLCLAPNNDCGCQDESSKCLTSPPNGDVFDCGPALADCAVTCENSPNATETASAKSATATATATATANDSATATVTASVAPSATASVTASASVSVPLSTGAVVSGSPIANGNGTVTAPTPSGGFTGAATKAGLSMAAVLVAGAALFL